jgi:hypothetical protein
MSITEFHQEREAVLSFPSLDIKKDHSRVECRIVLFSALRDVELVLRLRPYHAVQDEAEWIAIHLHLE